MKEQDVAKAYARSIIELSEEDKIDVAKELTNLQHIINSSNDLENLLFLDIFAGSDKKAVLGDIFKKISFPPMIERFILFLIDEKRIQILPSIYKEVMVFDDHRLGFIRASIEGKESSISSEDQEKIYKFLKEKIGREPKLSYKQKDNLTAGFRITAEDLQLDATIDHQFDLLKHSILGD